MCLPPTCLPLGTWPIPRHAPWLGIKPVTPWFAGWHSIHWATPARANFSLSFFLISKNCYGVLPSFPWILPKIYPESRIVELHSMHHFSILGTYYPNHHPAAVARVPVLQTSDQTIASLHISYKFPVFLVYNFNYQNGLLNFLIVVHYFSHFQILILLPY